MNVETRESRSIRPNQMNIVNYKEFYPATPRSGRAGRTTGRPARRRPAAGSSSRQRPASRPARPSAGGARRSPSQRRAGLGRMGRRSAVPVPLQLEHADRSLAAQSPHVYFGGNHLFKSVDRGDHWMIISPDLTTNDPRQESSRPAAIDRSRTTGAETHCTIITDLRIADHARASIWVGTDDGNVQVTRNGGVAWTNVRPNVPAYLPSTLGAAGSRPPISTKGRAISTFDGHRSDDFKPYVFKTTDYGKTWTNIADNLPDGQPVYVIREDLKNKNLLFVGTEFGVFFTVNGGKSWTSLSLNAADRGLPRPAHPSPRQRPDRGDARPRHLDHGRHLRPRAGDGRVLERGRVPLRNQPAGDALAADRARRLRPGQPLSSRARIRPTGALIHYYLKDKPAGPVTIEISDVTGQNKTTYLDRQCQARNQPARLGLAVRPGAGPGPERDHAAKTQLETIAGRGRADRRAESGRPGAPSSRSTRPATITARSWTSSGTSCSSSAWAAAGLRRRRRRIRRPRRRGRLNAEPGVYLVKMTAGGKTFTGKSRSARTRC